MKSKILIDLADSVGEFIEYWGFKKVHGQVWVLLYLSSGPLSSRQLKETLGISKALLSMTLNDLKDYYLVDSAGKGPNGVELFVAKQDFLTGVLRVLKRREQFLISQVELNLKSIQTLTTREFEALGLDQSRVRKLVNFTKMGQRALRGLIKLEQVSFSPWKIFTS